MITKKIKNNFYFWLSLTPLASFIPSTRLLNFARALSLFNASSVGVALVSGMLVGGVMGYFLDKWLGTSPWLLFVFLVFGFIAGVKNAIYYMKKAGIEVGKNSNNIKDK